MSKLTYITLKELKLKGLTPVEYRNQSLQINI